jgi:hypothetical protein
LRFLLLLALLSLSACHTIHPVGAPGNRIFPSGSRGEINWPVQYRPQFTTFFEEDSVDIDAPPEVVWDVLVHAGSWSEWFDGAEVVAVHDVPDGVLQSDAVFTWNADGFGHEAVVKEFDPPTRLGWETREATFKGYQTWLIVAERHGCRLVTAETGYGPCAWVGGVIFPGGRRDLHAHWLAAVKARAETLAAAPPSGEAGEPGR